MIMRKNFLFAILVALIPMIAQASGNGVHLKQRSWSFDGVNGKFDRQSIQRGYQVYKEVCAGCHSMNRIDYRNLTEVGFSVDEVKALAAEETIIDGPNDDGEMFERARKPSDSLPAPFPNEKSARAGNNGAFPPDLSLMIKARPDGANYVYSLLTGFEESAPTDMQIAEGMNYNPYFPGNQIAMAAPLSDDAVEYQDGTPATVDQLAIDMVNFLQWTAEPEMEERNSLGHAVLIYLFIFTILFYLAKKKIWSRLD